MGCVLVDCHARVLTLWMPRWLRDDDDNDDGVYGLAQIDDLRTVWTDDLWTNGCDGINVVTKCDVSNEHYL